jgi:hypothetical protein
VTDQPNAPYEPPQVEEIDSDGEPVATGAGVIGSPG